MKLLEHSLLYCEKDAWHWRLRFGLRVTPILARAIFGGIAFSLLLDDYILARSQQCFGEELFEDLIESELLEAVESQQ